VSKTVPDALRDSLEQRGGKAGSTDETLAAVAASLGRADCEPAV
jgi:hypothetical protein